MDEELSREDMQEIVNDDDFMEPMSEDDDFVHSDTDLIPENSEEPLFPGIEFEDDSVQGFFDHQSTLIEVILTPGPIYSIDINPIHQDIIVTGGGDDQSFLWRKDNGEKIASLTKHEDSVSAVAFSSDGSLVASGGMDGKVSLHDAINGSHIFTLEGPSEVVVSIFCWSKIVTSSVLTGIRKAIFSYVDLKTVLCGCGML